LKAPKAPPAPDPYATANAQTQTNRDSATSQQYLNQTNQTNPYGSLNYSTTGYNPDGTPIRTATTTFSPTMQGLFDQEQEFDKRTNQIGIDQTKRLEGVLSQPININNEATESRLMELGRKRLDPRFAQEDEALRNRLANQGVAVGSDAYNSEYDRFNQGKNDAYNQLLLGGRGQAVQEALTERNQPINEITALMSGGQVSQPNFMNTPNANVAGTDLGQMVYNSAGLNQQNFAQKSADRNAMISGLFGLGGAALGGWGRSGFALPK
jgi:hypothetical protein